MCPDRSVGGLAPRMNRYSRARADRYTVGLWLILNSEIAKYTLHSTKIHEITLNYTKVHRITLNVTQ